ncbi:MAG: polysaccharide pyruvyl transferase family protein [Thermodesulfobacteriota bacterium]|nr:polysaccharide pyruvyl transferase family protein [Thermodesulfobacteriota bacterium]
MTPLKIFVVDRVPLANKGEEAIIRGIEDLLADKERPIELAVFDRTDKTYRLGNITAFPVTWAFYDWGWLSRRATSFVTRYIKAGKRKALIYWRSLRIRYGLLGPYGRIAASRDGLHAEMAQFFAAADYVLVGHDGLFNFEHCGILSVAKQKGKRSGVLGAGGKGFRPRNGLVAAVYRQAVRESDFFVVRERGAYEELARIGCDMNRVRLAPDPAFAMKPSSRQEVEALLSEKPWFHRAREEGKLILGITVSHKEILLKKPFAHGQSRDERIRLHTEYLAQIYNDIMEKGHVFLVFLPHSLEGGARNDLAAAKGVASLLKASQDSFCVLEDDLPARTWKGIIGELDFLVGQRAHSLIGSAAVATPFVALTASNDRRTHDILGDMCGCEAQMVNMDECDPEHAAERILQSLDNRKALRSHLALKMNEFTEALEEIRRLVKGL